MKRCGQRVTWHIGKILLLLLLLSVPCLSFAQEEEDPAQAEEDVAAEEDPTAVEDEAPEGGVAASDSFFRIGFYEWNTQRFQGSHPFFEMTNNKFFRDGNTSLNSTQDNTVLLIPPPSGNDLDMNHERGEPFWVQIAHGLPPFSLEYIMPTDWPWLTAHSLEFYYTNTWLTDQTAKVESSKDFADVPIIQLRSHYYFFAYTLYGLFPPGPGQVELFYGLGGVYIESTIRNGIRPHGSRFPETRLSYLDLDHYAAEQVIGFQRIGLTTNAESFDFGLTFELYLLPNLPVMRNPFYNNYLIPTTPTKRKIDLQGLILRAAIVCNFW